MASSLERLAASADIAIHWRSFELRPQGSPPISAAYRARIEASKPQLYATAREQYGLELHQGPFGIDSRPALIGAKYAEEQGQGDAYHRAAFASYWLEGQSLEDHAVLRACAVRANLDPDAFMAALDEPRYLQQVLDDIAQAQAFGINAVPAMVFADTYLVVGAQPYDLLREVVTRVEAERQGSAE